MAESPVATPRLREEAPSTTRSAAAPEAAAPEAAPEATTQTLVRALHPGASGTAGAPSPPPPSGWEARRSASPRDLVALQRMAGNRAVAGLVGRRSSAVSTRPVAPLASVQRDDKADVLTPPPNVDASGPGDPKADQQARPVEVFANSLDRAAKFLGDETRKFKARDGKELDVVIYGLESTFMVVYDRKGDSISDRIPLELPKGMHFNPGVFVTPPGGGASRRLRMDPQTGRVRIYEQAGVLEEVTGKPAGPAAKDGAGARDSEPAPATKQPDPGDGSGKSDVGGPAVAPRTYDLRKFMKDPGALDRAVSGHKEAAEFFLVRSPLEGGTGTGKPGGARTTGFTGEVEGKGAPADMPPWPVKMDGPQMLPIGGKGTFLANINWAANGSSMIDMVTSQLGTSIHYRWEVFDISVAAKREGERAVKRAEDTRAMIRTVLQGGQLPEVDPRTKSGVAAPAGGAPGAAGGVPGAAGGGAATGAGKAATPAVPATAARGDDKSLDKEIGDLTRSKAGSGREVDRLEGADDEFGRDFTKLGVDSAAAWQKLGDSRAETAVERRWDDAGNLAAIALLPVSALVTTLGASLRWTGEFFGGEAQQQEIPMPKEGTFLIRVITTPRVETDSDGNTHIRPSSVASRTVEVTQMDRLVTGGLVEPGARVADLENDLKRLEDAPKKDETKIAALRSQLEMARLETEGEPAQLLQKKIDLKEKELAVVKGKYEGMIRGPIIEVENELDILRKRLELLKLQERRRTGGDDTLQPARRVNAVLISEVTGQPYPLLLSVGQMKGSGSQHKWKVLDATSKKAVGFEGVGATAGEALENAFKTFGEDAQYGRGIIGVRLSPETMRLLGEGAKSEFRVPSAPVGWAIARGRIDDLVLVLIAIGLMVASAGTGAALIGAAVAAAKLGYRLYQGTFEFDAETVSDLLAVLGGAAIVAQGAIKVGAQAVTGMRIQQIDKAFVLIPEAGVTESKITRATALVQKATDLARGVELANEVFNYAGVVWGNVTFLGTMMDIAAQEATGAITHAEARRQRATALGGALQNNGMFLAGNWKKAKDAAKKAAAKPGQGEGKPTSPSASDGGETTTAGEPVTPKDPAAATDPVAPKEPVAPKDPVGTRESVGPKEPAGAGDTDATTKGTAPKEPARAGTSGALPEGPAAGGEQGAGPTAKPTREAPKPGSRQERAAAHKSLQEAARGNGDLKAAAEEAIGKGGSWKEDLKGALKGLEGEERIAAEKALVEARERIVDQEWAKLKADPRYADLRLENAGTRSFGSDIDATIRPIEEARVPGDQMGDQVKRSAEAGQKLSEALRDRVGGETDAKIDTNIYSFIGEGRVKPVDAKARAAQQQVDIVVGLAEQLRGQKEGQSEGQFKAFEERLIRNLGDPRVVAEAKALLGEARKFHGRRVEEWNQALKAAKADPANKGDAAQQRAAREAILATKKGELSELIAAKPPDVEAIASKQAEINWFAPDAYATPSAFKQAVAHGQRLKGTARTTAEWSATDVAGKLREAAGRLSADDPHAGKLKADAQLVEDQGRLLESTTRELKAAQGEAPMDAGRVNELQRRAAQMREAIAARAEKVLIAEIMGETAPTDRPSAERLSESAAASGANMGMLEDHVRHAPDLDGKVKAAAKYAGRIGMAEFLAGLRPSGDPIARLIAEFVKGRWGILEDAAPQLMRDMFVRYARLTGRHTELSYNNRGEAVGATDALKAAFANDVLKWARTTNDGIQAAAIGSKAFNAPVPPPPAPGGVPAPTNVTGGGDGGSSAGTAPGPVAPQERPTIPVPPPDNGPATRREGPGAAKGDQAGGARTAGPAEPGSKLEGIPGGIRIDTDQSSVTVRAKDDPSALVRIEPQGNTLRLTDIFRRELPPGSGVILLVEGLKAVGAVRGNELLITGIINPETLASHKEGADPALSKLGKMAQRALEASGFTAGPMRWEFNETKLCISVDIL